MKQFSCGDVVPGCSRRFHGSEADILSAVEVHARADHGLLEIPANIVDQIRSSMVAA